MEVECSSEAQPLREDLLSSSSGRDFCGSWVLRRAWRVMKGPGSAGAAATVIGAGINLHARRVQLQTVTLLNDRLRDQYNPARAAEHFQNP